MLRIGKMTDYAILVVSQMAKTPNLILSAKTLAESLHLTTPTVSKILKMLADVELVTSVRGAEGGYLLSRSAETITVVDIINAMEGGLAMTECCEQQSSCVLLSMCTLRDNWKKINHKVGSMLARLTIQDMLQPLSEGVLHE